MKVSTISANTYTERFKLKALKAPKRGQENPIIENGITKKAIEIMKNLSEIIENDWTKIKKSGNLLDSPQYLVADKKGNFVTIKPVYQSQTEKYILMEVENDKTIDRVLFNRRKPYEYTFDHAVITPYGSASGKTYNSTKEHDKIVEDRVNSYIENFGKKAVKQAEERNLRT